MNVKLSQIMSLELPLMTERMASAN